MTKSTITREQLIKKAQEQIEFCRHTKITGEGRAHVNQCAALFEIALAAMDREHVRNEHAEWSQATFGNVGPVGPLKHLSKEALEAAAEPDDLSEWADMQFLLWDAQRRAGITDEHITQAMIDKLAVNKQREWPEPKDGEPRLHIKEQPAPVVSADLLHTAASAIEDLLEHTDPNTSYYSGVWADVPGKLRAAMFQAKSLTGNSPVIGIDLASGPDRTVEVHYVAPPGYVMVPKEPTKEMINAGWLYYMGTKNPSSKGTYKAMLAAAPQEVKGE
ncbi:DUF550 domain-containing protein [Klebsiella pneumoniae]|uniref:DUF550 domain-containing protein n=1 Tax=Klebsiella pneumoniae TaxID=573 RepID=UPI003975E3FE